MHFLFYSLMLVLSTLCIPGGLDAWHGICTYIFNDEYMYSNISCRLLLPISLRRKKTLDIAYIGGASCWWQGVDYLFPVAFCMQTCI